jgi:hypothetical protein
VHVSVSDTERQVLADQAHERGEAPLSFVRERMLERLAAHRRLPVLEDEDLEELRARTSELNRAVHQLHVLAADQPGPLDVDAIATQAADVLPALARAVAATRARFQQVEAAPGGEGPCDA